MPSPAPTALATAACLLVFEDIYNVKGLMCSVICSFSTAKEKEGKKSPSKHVSPVYGCVSFSFLALVAIMSRPLQDTAAVLVGQGQ